jgi:DNA-binding NarL/FixJ family response regulator
LYEAVGASDRRRPGRYEHAITAVRVGLGDAAFEEAWAAARALPLMEAVSEAMNLKSNSASAPATLVADEHLPTESCGLTPRELDVLRLIVAGQRDQEIAGVLFLSRRTVQTHVTHLLTKLGVNTRAEAAALAVRRGLV